MCTLSEVLFRSNLPVTMSFFSPYFSIIVNSILIGLSQRHLSLTCLCPCSCPPATSPAASGSYGSCSWPFLAAHPSLTPYTAAAAAVHHQSQHLTATATATARVTQQQYTCYSTQRRLRQRQQQVSLHNGSITPPMPRLTYGAYLFTVTYIYSMRRKDNEVC